MVTLIPSPYQSGETHNEMPRELLILRHAKSSWDSDAATDYDRPLAKRGEKDAPRMGQWLRDEGVVPDMVISSPARRAEQTTLSVCQALGIKKRLIRWEAGVYGASLGGLLKVLQSCPEDAKTVLLVGHNPGLETLVEYLAGTQLPVPEDGKLLPTAAVARLELSSDWTGLGAGSAHLASITRPRSLKQA